MDCKQKKSTVLKSNTAWSMFAIFVMLTWSFQLGLAQGNDGLFLDIRDIDAFVAGARERDVGAMTIPGPAQARKEAEEESEPFVQEKWAWGQSMLENLGRLWKEREDGKSADKVEMVLDLRDWCLGAPGAGNLQLAIAAEETAVELLFRGLSSGSMSSDEIRRFLARCSANEPTAEYWRSTLAQEGHSSAKAERPSNDAAEYLKLASVLNDIWLNGHDDPNDVAQPDDSGWQGGSIDVFPATQLMFRTLGISMKSVALEVCLEIQRVTGNIPSERGEFRRVADAHARNILGKQERLTSWMTPNTAWNYWHRIQEVTEKTAGATPPSEP